MMSPLKLPTLNVASQGSSLAVASHFGAPAQNESIKHFNAAINGLSGRTACAFFCCGLKEIGQTKEKYANE
jgi:hypothetical protein